MSRTGITLGLVILLAGMLVVALVTDARRAERFLDGFWHRTPQRDSAPARQISNGARDVWNLDLTDCRFKNSRGDFAPFGMAYEKSPHGGCTSTAIDLTGTGTMSIASYDIVTRQPMPESLAHLQFVADAVRCPVSDRSAIMASCVAQRYHKMRDKALSARARYDALVGLERAYWANLSREGLTQRVEHVRIRTP